MGDEKKGLYEKYKVSRADGQSEPGRKHEKCSYFVLDLNCDPHAYAAILAYAESCRMRYPALAADLRHEANEMLNRGFM